MQKLHLNVVIAESVVSDLADTTRHEPLPYQSATAAVPFAIQMAEWGQERVVFTAWRYCAAASLSVRLSVHVSKRLKISSNFSSHDTSYYSSVILIVLSQTLMRNSNYRSPPPGTVNTDAYKTGRAPREALIRRHGRQRCRCAGFAENLPTYQTPVIKL